LSWGTVIKKYNINTTASCIYEDRFGLIFYPWAFQCAIPVYSCVNLYVIRLDKKRVMVNLIKGIELANSALIIAGQSIVFITYNNLLAIENP